MPVAAQPSARRAMAVVAISGFAAAFTLLRGVWPEIYTFATDPSASLLARLMSAPIHLADDVMITLRSGATLLETGIPAFNSGDLAQASTSYLAPYLAAIPLALLPANAAAAAFGLLGFAAVVATWALIAAKSRSLINAAVLVGALCLTATNLEFSLTGWDHLLQGLFFTLGIVLAMSTPLTTGRLIAISLLAAGGALARPDGIIIAVALIWVALLRAPQSWRTRLLALLLPFGFAAVGMLVVNFLQFGFLTPTTTRLKAGGAPSWDYIVRYFWENSIYSYTALSLLILLIIVTILFHRTLPVSFVAPLAVAASLTAVIAVINSDFFQGGRMFWVPAVVVAVSLAITLPGVLRAGPAFLTDDGGQIATRLTPVAQWSFTIAGVGFAVGLAAVFGLQGAVVSKERFAEVRTAQQFLAAQWVSSELDPTDGAVGVFYAGAAAHMPDFAAADFLGKADEVIAEQSMQWGPPGHNKWNIDATLKKWNPQVILPTIDQDPAAPETDSIAAEWRERQWTHGYVADLMTNDQIRTNYRYCRVLDPSGFTDRTVDVLLRNDIAARVSAISECS